MLAVYHKLRRVMARDDLAKLLRHFAERTGKYFAYRNHSDEAAEIDAILGDADCACNSPKSRLS